MFSGLFQTSYKKINFEDIQYAIQKPNEYIIINTLPISEQDCLIKSTLPYTDEERIINDLLANYGYKLKKVIIYGKNSTDPSTDKKAKQLISLGFHDIYLYAGGLFEWLLLQDVYGKGEFPTVGKIGDILAFKPSTTFRSFKI